MKLHLLLTPNIHKAKPETCKIVFDYGQLPVVFEDRKETGLHCVVEDTEENIISWLKPFDYFIKGSGTPMFEQFEITYIKQ